MNVKKMIAAALLLVPVAAISLSVKPASAQEFYRYYEEPRFNEHRVITQETVYRFHHHRIWVPGHWDYDRYGDRFWIPGHYELRELRELRDVR